MKITPVRDYLLGLQDSIVSSLELLDGGAFLRDEWKRACKHQHADSSKNPDATLERTVCHSDDPPRTSLTEFA